MKYRIAFRRANTYVKDSESQDRVPAIHIIHKPDLEFRNMIGITHKIMLYKFFVILKEIGPENLVEIHP